MRVVRARHDKGETDACPHTLRSRFRPGHLGMRRDANHTRDHRSVKLRSVGLRFVELRSVKLRFVKLRGGLVCLGRCGSRRGH